MDVGEMQRKLSQWATENPEDQYRDLYSLLCQETWLRVAHHSVNTNQGRETAGIDGRTMMMTSSLVPTSSWTCCANCTLMRPSSPQIETLRIEDSHCTLKQLSGN